MGWGAFWVVFVVVVIAAYLGVGDKRVAKARPFTAFLVAIAMLAAAAPFALPKSQAEAAPKRGMDAVAAPPEFTVPNDRATYTVLALSRRSDGIVEISTRRSGPSGVSYSESAIDCDARLSGYIREGDSLAAFKSAPRQSPQLERLVVGSLADMRARWACKHAPA
jgi:hypothetical protein